MKKFLLYFVLFFVGINVIGQTTGVFVPIWSDNVSKIAKIGPTLTYQNGQLDVATGTQGPAGPAGPPGPGANRRYGIQLGYDSASGGWPVPSDYANDNSLEVFVNGLHYWNGADYTYWPLAGASVIKANANNMDPTFSVRINYNTK